MPVEFANTWYNDAGTIVDYLATAEMMSAWFALAPEAADHQLPKPLTDEVMVDVRDLRDSIHEICGYLAARSVAPPMASVRVLNAAAGRSAARFELDWSDSDQPTAAIVYSGRPGDVLLASVANSAISFLAGPDRNRVRACATPDCDLLFVQRHHLRRFCSEPCAQRSRQGRYYQRRHSIARREPAAQ